MSKVPETLASDGILDSLSRCLDTESANRVIDMEIGPEVQARVNVLAQRANEGLLTAEERAEYEAFVNLDDILTILRLKARRQRGSGPHGGALCP
jgi:hypothetical protein